MLVGSLIFLAGILLLTRLGWHARRMVRSNAPFYATTNILIVGTVYGLTVGTVVHFLARAVGNSTPVLVILTFWGLLSTLYLGYDPDPIDWAKKAGQTRTVATLAYFAVSAALLFK